jgi:polysaccharide deacetylase family protein (PEP-CTERM system associated)
MPVKRGRPALALSVDVEDWPQSSWDRDLPISDYCADNVRRILDLLAEFPEARATFFVLGKFAERHGQVARAIASAGHEVASHGYGHVEAFRLGREAFAEDLRRGAEALARATGVQPTGYRAPDFSVVGESLWVLDVLAEAGYAYDSSIFPIAKARYGIAGWPRHAARVKLESGRTITELPPATLEQFGRRVPVGGGGYARLLPGFVLTWALRKASRQLGQPPVFYCHPYELDPKEFRRLAFKVPLKVRLHQDLGRGRTAGKLRRLLRQFECIGLEEALRRAEPLPEVDYKPWVLAPGSVERPPIF